MAAQSGWLGVESGGKAQGDLAGAGGLDLARTEQRLGQGEDRRVIEEVGKRRVLLDFAAIGLGAQIVVLFMPCSPSEWLIARRARSTMLRRTAPGILR